ncbi:MAG: TolC family protein [Planctomycetes bacterium]|nr:TolC family protein [Planctomycetota bacterium]
MTGWRRLIATVLAVAAAAGCRSLPSGSVTDEATPPIAAPAPNPAADSDLGPNAVIQAAYVQEGADQAPPPPEELLPPLPPGEAAPLPAPAPDVVIGGATLQVLELLALASNPTLRQAAADVAEARGRWVQSGLYPNPQVGYAGNEINADGQAGQQGGFVSQTFVTGGKLDWSRAAAARAVDRAVWEMEAQQLRVLTEVRIRFYEALGAQQTVMLAEELRRIAEQGVSIAQQLERALEAPRTDVLQSEVELANVRLLLETARQREFAARQQLAAVVGVVELPCAPLSGLLEEELLLLEWCTFYERLLAGNPLLQIAQARVAQARARLQREQVEPIPNVNVQVGSQYDFSSDDTLYSAQVQLPLPLYDRNQGAISAAAAELRQAMDEVERIERVLQRRLAEVWRRYAAARAQVEIYQATILPRVQETLDLTTEAYEGAQLDFLRVLTARRSYFETRLKYLEAVIELRTAAAELDGLLLTGGLEAPGEADLPGE